VRAAPPVAIEGSSGDSSDMDHHDRGNAHTNRSVRWVRQSTQQIRAGVSISARIMRNSRRFFGFFGANSRAGA
jgi:hypothetical protein